MHELLVKWLFETKALRISPENEPFFYTSGKIGPFYINTHFLYGSEEKANELLKVIDENKGDPNNLYYVLNKKVEENYNSDDIYKQLIDNMVKFAEANIDLNNIDYISGGERRDWFFSLMMAKLLKKKHITIFKDMSVAMFDENGVSEIDKLGKANVLHVADLITEASSYERAWIPAIEKLEAKIAASLVVIDRRQGGKELLNKYDVKSYSMGDIDIGLFDKAIAMGYINKAQYDLVKGYIENPDKSMKEFVREHPEFLESALNSNSKLAERAKLCIEKGFYK